MVDLEEVIIVARRAVAATPDAYLDRACWLSNLGSRLKIRYQRTRAIADLEEAVIIAREAVAATPDNHPDCAAWLNNLGD
jgi:hypothetical protein